ncbi:MAG: hypothetical protein LDL27_01650 [Desulfovibrio sp.]|nr:hypothetical protein [Desulfovibrio sp.]
MVHRVPSFLRSGVLPCLCLAVLAVMLCVPRTFLVSEELTPGLRLPMPKAMDITGPGQLRLPFRLMPPQTQGRLESLELRFTTSRYALRVANATMFFNDSACLLEAPPQMLWDKGGLQFVPAQTSCAALFGNATASGVPLAGELRMTLLDHGSASLVVTVDPHGGGHLQVGQGHAALGLWRWQPAAAPTTRLRLLAAMWDSHHGGWIVGLLGAATLLASLGLHLRTSRPAVTCGLCALALGMAYAVVSPPFQAPDEPDHFLSWTRLAGNPALEADAERLARVGHFERLKHNPFETFGPWHIGAPNPVPWEVEDEDGIELVGDSMMETRSALTLAFWSVLRPVIAQESAARAVLGIRLANALCFGLAAWGGAALLFRLTGRRVWPWFLFLVPTLPFFAMHISNYAQFTAASVVLACAGLAVLFREEQGGWFLLGGWLGAAAAVLVLSASTGVAAAVFVLAMALAGLPVRWSTPDGPRRFWAGLALGGAGLLAGVRSEQMAQMLRVGGRLAGLDGPAPWWTPVLLAWLGCAACCGLELLARRVAGDSAPSWLARLARLGRLGAAGVAISGAIACLYSGFHQFRMHPCMPPPGEHPGFWADILNNLPTLLSFREPDTLLSRTFWGGFGWHDALLPVRLVQALAGAAGLGLVLLGWKAARDRGGTLGWRVCCWLAGSWGLIVATGLAAAAAGHERALPNVHGRYLLAGYCVLLAGTFAGWSLTMGAGRVLRAVAPAAGPGRRLLEGWLLTGAGLVLVLGLMRFSLPQVFNWLPLDGLHLTMAAGFPLLGWWWLRGAECQLSLGNLLAGGVLLGLGACYAELGFGLPRVFVRYPFGFFVLLGGLGLVWLAAQLRAVQWEPAADPAPSWPAIVTCVAAHALHTGALAFLLVRYLG